MSLTTILKQHQAELGPTDRSIAGMLSWNAARDIVVKSPPNYGKSDYSLVGTAFDFWLRAHLVVTHGARETRTVLDDVAAEVRKSTYGGNPKVRLGSEQEFLPEAIARISSARARAIAAKAITDAPFYANCIEAARIEGYYRHAKASGPACGSVDADLARLANVVQCNDFLFRCEAIDLTPSFATYGPILGGADADLALGDTIVEIKTTRDLYPAGTGVQLLSYALLGALEAQRNGTKPPYRKIAIYAARYGLMATALVNDLLPQMDAVRRVLYGAIAA